MPTLCPGHSQNLPIAQDGMRIMHEILGLCPVGSPDLADVLLVVVDFENPHGIRFRLSGNKLCSQAGLAILDTKQLEYIHIAPDQAIKTHNFVTGPRHYVDYATRQSVCQTTETRSIRASEMAACIQSKMPPHRNVVIAGHAVANELHVLQHLQLYFTCDPIILDTEVIAHAALKLRGLSLCRLLGAVGCPHHQLHHASNDAFFTLRALLLLAIAGCTAETQIQCHARLDLLQRISTFPILSPKHFDPLVPTPSKKGWRTSRQPPRQPKKPRCSPEEQDRIRAQREREREEKKEEKGVKDSWSSASDWDLESLYRDS